jgi:hypothetical protein
MWETERFIVANGFTQFNDQNVGRDLSPYDFFDGEISGNDLEFSDARGRRRKKRKKGSESGVEKALSYTPVGWIKKGVDSATSKDAVSRREKRRADRMNLKRQEIEAQKQIADKSLKAQEKDATLLSSLGLSDNKNLPEVSPNKTKSNTIYWVVGGLAVATILGVVLYKKYKK